MPPDDEKLNSCVALKTPMAQPHQPSMRDETVEKKTGKTRAQWFQILDRWGAVEKGHKETALFLQAEHDVTGWWAQTITVEHERARGLRAVGQRLDGDYEFSIQRTVPAGVDEAVQTWMDPPRRNRWVPPEWKTPLCQALDDARGSETAMGTVVRADAGLAESGKPVRLEITFTPKDRGKTQVVVVVSRLSAQARESLKPAWTKAMDDYRDMLRDEP